ncbi:oxygenase MpaB family protein [Rhodonellum sp.]|uniref:oxygenase MpaB family protein n=1 Tax=Rhodonellum sp. TaxID=2231180 RepID=UPI00271ADEE1|nr:oxygenase MpaB family protein [Rhodonellum sp.]MDO9553378.1 oxygenase MpaB family protein [Rhodonellum sp.]
MENNSTEFEWNGIDLESLRKVMDQPADDAVQAVFESHSMNHLREMLIQMAENDSAISSAYPQPMQDLVKSELTLAFTPHDIKMFEQTHHIWKKHGMNFIFILFFRALPYTYMAEKPANVLKMTKLLTEHPERRIFETAQFVFDVMDKDWWKPHKRGVLTALKIRIMHSAMRHALLNSRDGEKWNPVWGNPISQEDLIATNQVFSLEFFKGMAMMGEELTQEEQEAWFHTWKTIGKIMGVQEDLITENVADAWDLQHKVYCHLFKDETVAGILLTEALVKTLHHFHLPTPLILLMMRKLLADEQFPDCFERMLGPTYRRDYPEIFAKPETHQERAQHEEVLRGHFHKHLGAYYSTIKEKREDILKDKPDAKPKLGFIQKLILWIKGLFGGSPDKKHLIDHHIDFLHNILHHKTTGKPVEKLEEDMILESMKKFGGIMVGILSLHFRKGKQSGFRIPENLKEIWSLT